jgi:hypothetical protein
MWLGGNWARGEALRKDVWLKDGQHNFCAILSGARGFLGGTDLPQELSIQLYRSTPLSRQFSTRYDARREGLRSWIARLLTRLPQAHEGNPYGMGELIRRAAHGRERPTPCNVCLWCDSSCVSSST